MAASGFDFVDSVVAARGLLVTSASDHACRLEHRDGNLAWFCDLDDGTPTGDSDPASFVRWVCPVLGVGESGTGAAPLLSVSRTTNQSDLGRLVGKLARWGGRSASAAPGGGSESVFAYTDPVGVLDDALRRRIENWPSARHGDGVTRPAELWSVKQTREGLVVESVSWWDSAPALDHQIGLAVDIARQLAARR